MGKVSTVLDKTTTQLFLDAASQWPDRIRWRIPAGDSWNPVSWQDYCRRVSQVAAALHSMGYRYDDKIGILANNSIEWIYSALGIMTANTILVPVYAGSTPEQSMYLINHSDMKILFAGHPKDVNRLRSAGLEQSRVENIVLLAGDSADCESVIPVMTLAEVYDSGENHMKSNAGLIEDLAKKPQLEDIAYMIYTSGTTGNPKGVPLSHRNLAASTSDWLAVNGPLIPENVVDIHWLPNSHCYGWGAIGLGNIFGFESYLGTPLDVLELLPKLKPHLFMSVPAYYEKLYILATTDSSRREEQLDKLNELTGGRIQFLLSGGAGLKVAVKEFFLEAGMWITEGYGLSECSPTLTMNRQEAYRFDSVGLPFPSVQLKLAEDGEILAKGDNVFSGYYKDPEATRAVFTTDGWFKTGDVGEWLEGGFLRIIDRKKDIIVTAGGKNIPPQNIELRFNDDPFIDHLIVYGDGKKYLVALVTLNAAVIESWAGKNEIHYSSWIELIDSVQIQTLIRNSIDSVNQELASFETIKRFKIIRGNFTPENGLLTAALKVRRREIYSKYKMEFEALYP